MNSTKFNNPIVLEGVTSAPSTFENGMIYYNSTSQSFFKYEGGAWTKDVSETDLQNYYTKAEIDALTTTAIAEGTNLYFTTARARTAAVVNSTAGNETDQAASVAAMKSYVATATDLTNYYTKSQTDTLLDDKADQVDLDQEISDRMAADALLIPLAQKGANNGVATLDAGGKVPVSQLPNSVMEYKGNWDASTNTPTLADGTGNAGDVYRVNVAGSQNLGSGTISFDVGDWVVYNGSIWEKSLNSDAVTSVNGQQGVVVLDTDDISEGASNLYYTQSRFDSAFTAKDTDDLSEGSSNLYFTDTRAKTAAVVDSTAGSQTDQAASVSSMKTYVNSQGFLKNVVEDTTPELGGDLDIGSHKIFTAQNTMTLQSAQNTVVRSNGTKAIQDKYISDISLSSSQTNATLSTFTVPFATIDSLLISYRIKDSSGDVRMGTLNVVCNGTVASLTDTFNDTANGGFNFNAAVSGSNLIIQYTSGARSGTMYADVKQFFV